MSATGFSTAIKAEAAVQIFPWAKFGRGGTPLRPTGYTATVQTFKSGGISDRTYEFEAKRLTDLCLQLSLFAARRAKFVVESTHEPGSHSAQDPA